MGNCLVSKLKAEVNNPNLPIMPKYTKLSLAVSTGTTRNVFREMKGKKGIFRFSSPDGAVAFLIRESYGMFTGSPIWLNWDLTEYTGNINVNVSTAGTLELEILENSLYVDDTSVVNVCGTGCYIDSNNNIPTYNSAGWAASSLLSNPISTSKKITFASEGDGKTVDVWKWNKNGEYVGKTSVSIASPYILDLSQYAPTAAYVTIEANTSAFPNEQIITSVL